MGLHPIRVRMLAILAACVPMCAGQDILALVNEARTDPAGFAERYIKPHGGASAAECYRVMTKMRPMGALLESEVLRRSSAAHAADMGRHGRLGHVGTDGSNLPARIERYGRWSGAIAENCTYGIEGAAEVVAHLLIDDGVADRGHRHNLLNGRFRYVGIAVAAHKTYGTNCVQDFAESVTP